MSRLAKHDNYSIIVFCQRLHDCLHITMPSSRRAQLLRSLWTCRVTAYVDKVHTEHTQPLSYLWAGGSHLSKTIYAPCNEHVGSRFLKRLYQS